MTDRDEQMENAKEKSHQPVSVIMGWGVIENECKSGDGELAVTL